MICRQSLSYLVEDAFLQTCDGKFTGSSAQFLQSNVPQLYLDLPAQLYFPLSALGSRVKIIRYLALIGPYICGYFGEWNTLPDCERLRAVV